MQTALYLWRILHSFALLAGTTVVALGFATGLMYLIQSYRLNTSCRRARISAPEPGMAAGFQPRQLDRFQLLAGHWLPGGGDVERRRIQGRTGNGCVDRSGRSRFGIPLCVAGERDFVPIVLQARPSGQKDSLSGDGQFSLSGIGAVLRLLWSTRRAMKLRVVGCSHHQSSVEARERLAFSPEQTGETLSGRALYSQAETVLLSTCNRVEFYFAAAEPYHCPARPKWPSLWQISMGWTRRPCPRNCSK